ncbi:MAG: hypothetical protein K2F64_01555 [Muribaculaceae bacterium]|nr:hypothetical protein [Muribaculaceae bacterium]
MNDIFDKGGIRGKLHATDWLSDPIYEGAGCDIVQVQFKNTRNGFFRCPPELQLSQGDIVAVEANPGHDIGRVLLTGPLVRLQMKKARMSEDSDLKKVFRIARPADLEKFEEAKSREHATMIRSRQIAADLGLDMKIGDVEYQGDGGKAIFYYIADERVDFRKLIRILADAFKVRIEMKQIGARQEAGRIGGIGPCGRPLCCSSWMSRFVSVGTGAARMQDLSMNPQKLAGQCAKLKCCLNFETDVYAEASRRLPPKDAQLLTLDNTYYFFKPDILAGTVTYSTDKNIPANLVTISCERALEIIEMNKAGTKPETLAIPGDSDEPNKEYIDLTDQDSLTRFDKSKKKRRRNKSSQPKEGERQQEKSGGKKKEDRRDDKKDGRREDRNADRRPREKSSGGKNQKRRQGGKPKGDKPRGGNQESHRSNPKPSPSNNNSKSE